MIELLEDLCFAPPKETPSYVEFSPTVFAAMLFRTLSQMWQSLQRGLKKDWKGLKSRGSLMSCMEMDMITTTSETIHQIGDHVLVHRNLSPMKNQLDQEPCHDLKDPVREDFLLIVARSNLLSQEEEGHSDIEKLMTTIR